LPRFCYPTSSVALKFVPFERCAGAIVVRLCLPPVGRAHSFPKHYCHFLRARCTGFSHRVGVCSVYFAPTLRCAPLQTPAKVATWHTKIRHLAYVLSPSSVLRSDQSSSRVPSETFPSQSGPAFLLPPSAVLSVWTGVMRFPRELPLLEVSAGLGGVASCL